MIIPNVEERISTILEKCKAWRILKQEGFPVQYTDEVGDKTLLPTGQEAWKPFEPPYTLYQTESYYWFRGRARVETTNPYQKAYLCVDTHIDGRWVSCTIRPQGLLYLNGNLVQGVDINHVDVAVEDGEYDLCLLFYTHTFDRYLPVDFYVRYVDERINALYYDLLVPYQALKLLSPKSNEYIASLSVLEKALHLLDVRNVHSAEFYASVEAVRAFLAEHYYGVLCGSKQTVSCIAHTHIDVAWLWDLDQTQQKVERSFSTVLKLMEEYPEYRFFSSQPQLFDFLKERNPALYERVKEKIVEGRWEVDGGMWLEADCNLTSGESLVRQIVFGKRFFREEFGKECDVVWLPDVFGYSASLPQIMKKSGLTKFVTAKIGWNDTNRMPFDAFKWRGIDGSEVFAYFLSTCECDPRNGVYDQTYTTYTAPINPMYIMGTWNRFQQKEYSNTVLMSFGWGDGGGGPMREDLEMQKRLSYGVPGLPKTKIQPLKEALQEIKESFDKNAEELRRVPTWNGELYFEYHRGTLTSVPQVKMNNRKGEFALMNAELFGVLGGLLCGIDYPKATIDENWKRLLLNQFHDILPGSSIEAVYRDSEAQFATLFSQTGGVTESVLEAIAGKVNANGGVLVFNPNGFTASAPVSVDGKTLIASEIPAFGYRVIAAQEKENGVRVEEKTLENSRYQIIFDETGAIVSLTDKRVNRQLVKEGRRLNELIAYQDTPYQYDNWEMTPYHHQNQWRLDGAAQFEALQEGERAGFAITKRYGNSTIVQRVYLYGEGVDRIDFVTEIDWKEQRQLLKANFPLDVAAQRASYDIQFGHVERATHDNTSWDSARFESAAQKWVDVSEHGYGVAILNDGKYGFGVDDGDLSMTFLKSGGFPFEGASEKIPAFTYSLLPHTGGGVAGGVVEAAYLLNRPMLVKQAKGKGELPSEYSLLSVQPQGVIVETVKRAEAGDGMILRLFEAYRERKTVTLKMTGVTKAAICDLEENELSALNVTDGVMSFEIKPFEIITLKVKGV